MAGLRVVFDPACDGVAWPGPLGGRDAAAGELWLGPVGLLGRLETELGLGGRFATELERAAELVPLLEATPGYWSESLEAAPLPTARRLLRDRDALRLWGWRRQPLSERLDALWQVTRELPPGLAERADAVIAALATRGCAIDELALYTGADELEPMWAALAEALGSAGVTIDTVELPPAAAEGDLARARGGGFEPAGDGSLTLLRSHGALAAADEVAAALAAMDGRDDVLIIGGDEVLDAALRRHGLPGVGFDSPPACAALPRLVLSCAFQPTEPADIHALLCADPGPVPRAVAARLLGVLGRYPGRGSAQWHEALERGLEAMPDDRRDALRERIVATLMPVAAAAEAIDRAALDQRLIALTTWARGRMADEPLLAAAVAGAEAFRELMHRAGPASLRRRDVAALLDELGLPGASATAAEAGLAFVDSPAAMLGPAATTVWWRFDRAAAPHPGRLRLSPTESEALRAAGITPPDSGALMERAAKHWRRPLEQTREHLLLVAPQTDRSGEPNHPHPLWDELVAVMEDSRHAERLIATELEHPARAERKRVARRPMPESIDSITVPGGIALRDTESPSSLEKLLGCSLAYAFSYPGNLRSGWSSAPPKPGPLLYGNLAHHAIERVFSGAAVSPEEAEASARAFLAGELAGLCETLHLPRYQYEHSVLSRAIVESARELARIIAAAGARVRGVELLQGRDQDGFHLAGRADLVLDDPPAIIDLKWGKTSHVERLERGGAFQLAAYAEIFRDGDGLPHIGYFSLNHRQLFVDGACGLDGTSRGPAADATWSAAADALAAAIEELGRGQVRARGNAPDAVDKSGLLKSGTLAIAAPCQYCDHALLCGKERA